MPSDLQITNIRDQANANSAITIGSDGQVTVNQNNPTLTLGTNTTVNTQDYFQAKLSGVQTISNQTWTEIAWATETDPNNWFDTSTKKFQPTKAGKYLVVIHASIYANDGLGNGYERIIFLKKNNTDLNSTETYLVGKAQMDPRNSSIYAVSLTMVLLEDMNGSSGYLYSMIYNQNAAGSFHTLTGKLETTSHFSAIRIGS